MSLSASSSFATDASASALSRSHNHPLLAPLNDLLAALLIPITLSSLSLATPSILLTVLESLLETRFPSISQEVRSSWDRAHRIDVARFLIEALAHVVGQADLEAAKRLRSVEVGSVVKGRTEAVSELVEGLLIIARRMGLLDGQPEEVAEPPTGLDDQSRASTPTPGPSRLDHSPTQTLAASSDARTPPPRPPSNLSTSSRVTLRHVVAISPPLESAAPTPLTPRSQLRLQGLANALAANQPRTDRPPLFVPPTPMAPSDHEIVRPVPRKLKSSFEGEDPFASRRIDTSEARAGASTSPPRVTTDRKGKGRAEAVEACECGASLVGAAKEASGVCSCADESEDAPMMLREPRKKAPTQHRRRSALTYDSNTSDDLPYLPPLRPPARPATHPLPPSARPTSHRHSRSKSAVPIPRRPSHSSHTARPSVQIQHVHSGYLPVFGESEVEAFERRQRRKGASLGPKRGGGERGPKLPPGWLPSDDEDPPALPNATSSRESTPARPPETSLGAETPSPYTLLLLSQRARLAEKLRALQLGKMERERAKVSLAETTDSEPPVVVRRRVERVGAGWKS